MLFTAKISGGVQGVGFRYSVRAKAQELKLAGFVRNEPDGSVYVEAEGSKEKLGEFWKWLERGTPGRTKRIESEFSEDIRGYDEFRIE